MDIIKVN